MQTLAKIQMFVLCLLGGLGVAAVWYLDDPGRLAPVPVEGQSVDPLTVNRVSHLEAKVADLQDRLHDLEWACYTHPEYPTPTNLPVWLAPVKRPGGLGTTGAKEKPVMIMEDMSVLDKEDMPNADR